MSVVVKRAQPVKQPPAKSITVEDTGGYKLVLKDWKASPDQPPPAGDCSHQRRGRLRRDPSGRRSLARGRPRRVGRRRGPRWRPVAERLSREPRRPRGLRAGPTPLRP